MGKKRRPASIIKPRQEFSGASEMDIAEWRSMAVSLSTSCQKESIPYMAPYTDFAWISMVSEEGDRFTEYE
jgi:hypothetical protein